MWRGMQPDSQLVRSFFGTFQASAVAAQHRCSSGLGQVVALPGMFGRTS